MSDPRRTRSGGTTTLPTIWKDLVRTDSSKQLERILVDLVERKKDLRTQPERSENNRRILSVASDIQYEYNSTPPIKEIRSRLGSLVICACGNEKIREGIGTLDPILQLARSGEVPTFIAVCPLLLNYSDSQYTRSLVMVSPDYKFFHVDGYSMARYVLKDVGNTGLDIAVRINPPPIMKENMLDYM